MHRSFTFPGASPSALRCAAAPLFLLLDVPTSLVSHTTTKVAICDDLLVTLLTFVTEWYVLYDEFSNFVIGGK
jgi:hypothetical protein